MSAFKHASLNRSFSLVWNEESQAWVPAPEGTRARGKRGGTTLAAAMVLGALVAGGAWAAGPPAGPVLPTGGVVTAGQAHINQAGNAMTIQQGTQSAAIDWNTFNIGVGSSVKFVQPSANAVMLNRVVGQDPSQILGSMQANGQVFLVNPNGILFAQGAQVSTAGLLASTRDISNTDFMAGRYSFSGTGSGQVVNQGSLSAQQGGYVALVGAQVVNSGSIHAPGGDVKLAAADAVSLRIDGAGLTGFTVDRGTVDGLVANHGLIQAQGGRVALTADAADALAKAVVNHTGIIEAQGVENVNGVVVLRGDAAVGSVNVSGRIDVSSATGKGGEASLTAHAVNLYDGATVDASGALGGGRVRVGGGWQGQDADLANASIVSVAPGARIDVSATQKGDGGTAVLWSQDYTAFGGDIVARGGSQGGQGGRVETSSKDVLQAIGNVDVSAALGRAGAWLLDPYNVTIVAANPSGDVFPGTGNPATFTPGQDSIILASTIVNALSSGANVTITTGSGGASAGNITVDAPILATGPANQATTLTLLAANNINVNAAISHNTAVTGNRLNVVLTPGSNGNVNFSSSGSITTGGGNAYIGTLSGTGTSEAVSATGQNLTLASGSFIDVAGGMLDAKVNGTITLDANTVRNSGGTAHHNNGNDATRGSLIVLSGSGITSSNTDAAVADIQSQASTTLQAGTIGSAVNPIKVSGYTDSPSATLFIRNQAGSSYVHQISRQSFRTVNVAIGSQLNAVQDIRLMNDFGGTGHDGTGHLLLQTDGTGVLNLADGDIRSAGTGSTKYTNVEISSTGTITFADAAVNTGLGSFSATATTLRSAAAPNDVAEIVAPTITLQGNSVGQQANLLELSSGSTTTAGTLNVTNNGGSTFLKSVDDNFTRINLTNVKNTGSHSIQFSGGDHIDYSTDGSNVMLPTLSSSTGVDTTRRNRSVSMTAQGGGGFVFDDNAVNLGSGAFSATIPDGSLGSIAAKNDYNASAPVAQITAGDVSLAALKDSGSGDGAIGKGNKHIQIAQGAGAVDNTLSVNTRSGAVSIHELTQNHFKTISLNVDYSSVGSSSHFLNIDLSGPDDVQFTVLNVAASEVSMNTSSVAVADNNRNFSLTATGLRDIRYSGATLGSGNFTLSTENILYLNGNISTNGGDIRLTGGSAVTVRQNVRVDSNADRLGRAGSIMVDVVNPQGGVSSGFASTLTLDASSQDAAGGSISLLSHVGRGGALGGLTLNAAGATSADDGRITLGSTRQGAAQLIDLTGDLSVTGRTTLANEYGIVVSTTLSSGASGSIRFAGADLSSNSLLGASTFHGRGSVNLQTQNLDGGTLNMAGLTISAAAVSGVRDITLPAVSTTSASGGPGNQSYTSGNLILGGNLTSAGGNIFGNVSNALVAGPVTIDTRATGQAGASGAVTITGRVSASVANASLNINTSSTASNGGGVVVSQGMGNAGGHYLRSLDINATGGPSSTSGGITLTGITMTEGAQTYAGAALNTGGLSTNGGDIDLRNVDTVSLTGSTTVILETDRAGGSNAAGALRLGTTAITGNNRSLGIYTTADGGGAHAGLSLGSVNLTGANASLSVEAGSVTLGSAVQAGGAITIEARGANADLTLASGGSVANTSTGNIVLAAGRNFLNQGGAGALAPRSGGRYLVYSSNPTDSLEGVTGYNKHYNQTYTAGSTPTYAGSGNWFLYSVAPVVTVSGSNASVVYGNADPTATPGAGHYSGFIDGDTLASGGGTHTLTLPSGTLSSGGYRTVGSYTYGLGGTVTDNLGYQYVAASQMPTLTVTPMSLAISGVTASNKVYDGTASATFNGNASVAAKSGDVVTLDTSGASGSFAGANAGNGVAVTASGYVLGGADAANYTVVQPTGLSANITPKALTISGSSVTSKTYDGGVNASVVAGTLVGLVGTETLAVSGTGQFLDKNAQVGKDVTTTYTLGNSGTGSNAGLASNYTLAGETLSGTITPKAITVGATGQNKVYDGGLSANASLAGSGILSGDTISFSGSAAFADKNAGSGKDLNVTGISATGADAGNYSFNGTASTTATITPKAISVGATGVDKVYDGGLSANASLAGAGILSGDDISFSGSAAFADKNAGSGKTLNVTGISASGADAGNYSFNGTASTTATILAKAITVAAAGVGKVYDGSLSASASLSSAGVVAGDEVSFGGSASFTDKNAGSGKAVNVTGISASGADAANYTLNNGSATTTADITAKSITVSATGANKVYDGSTSVSTTLASNGLVAGDEVNFSGNASLADKNAGSGKAVTVTGISASGADAGNYSVNTSASTTVDVAAKAITVAAAGVGKVYDGSLSASASLSSAGVVAGDEVSFGGSARFTDKNAGSGKAVNVTGISASGTDAGNYTLSSNTATTTADITAKAITVSATGANKVYDGSTSVSTTLAANGLVAGDVVNFSGNAAFADKNAGSGKAVNVTGISASGTDAGNYTLSSNTATTTADITAKAITVSATGANKVYDGSTSVSTTLASNGLVAGDVVNFSGNASMTDKNAGNGKAVTVTGISASGADAGNYSVNTSASTTVDVATRAITVTLQGEVAKQEDGNNRATLGTGNYAVGGLVAGESLTVTQTAGQYADTTVGTGKTVSTTLAAGDYQAGAGTLLSNYTLAVGPLSAAIGELKSSAQTSPGYLGAVNDAASSALVPRPAAVDALFKQTDQPSGQTQLSEGRGCWFDPSRARQKILMNQGLAPNGASPSSLRTEKVRKC